MAVEPRNPRSFRLNRNQVFETGRVEDSQEEFFVLDQWDPPIHFFVGRNGSGKSKTARAIASMSGGARLLSTDRLTGLMNFTNYGWMSVPDMENHRGIPLGTRERTQSAKAASREGVSTDQLFALKDHPETWIRVSAFIRKAFGRTVELHEVSGFLDPRVRVGQTSYSLLREEGHGLRELVLLLAATYEDSIDLLVVDEPELHLHPSLARVWLSELERQCRATGRRAIVVTHEPGLIRPQSSSDLSAITHFQLDRSPLNIGSVTIPEQADRITSSLRRNPSLVADLLFSSRPVLVEGRHDVAAIRVALERVAEPAAAIQTDLIECGGSSGVALWFEIARHLGLDVRAVADLDACMERSFQRTLDGDDQVLAAYREQLHVEPPRTTGVIQPLLRAMDQDKVAPDPKARAAWLASQVPHATGWRHRKDALLETWKSSGVWLHPQGTIEGVLQIEGERKSVGSTIEAAARSGPIDNVAEWCAFRLDPTGEIFDLLGAAVEQVAHRVMEVVRLHPSEPIGRLMGPAEEQDARLVDIEYKGEGRYRLTVVNPAEFAGYYTEFSRSTPSDELMLRAPAVSLASEATSA